jgi:hypothetical protein
VPSGDASAAIDMIGQDRNRSHSHSHSHGNQLAGRAGGFVTGSLAWQVDRLGVGESLLKAGALKRIGACACVPSPT